MLHIQSEQVNVAAHSAAVYERLILPAHIESLLPEGKYSEWKSDDRSCSFKLQGMYTVALQLVDQTPHHQIVWKSAEGSAIAFSLTLKLEDQDAACLAQLHCDADVNAFMEMMVKAPLKSLFDSMAKKLQRQFAPGA
jgi:carbon monoxide dehydrogenase subunit G